MNQKNFIFSLTFLSLLSCMPKDKDYIGIASIKDDSLKVLIKRYVDDEHIDVKSHFISIDCTYQPNKVVYKISVGKNSQSYKLSPPDYFALIDDIVVLIWVTNDETVELGAIVAEIDKLISNKKISLEDKPTYYDPPVWTLVKCGSGYNLALKFDETIQDVLPCGYSIKFDWSSDSVSLIKKK